MFIKATFSYFRNVGNTINGKSCCLATLIGKNGNTFFLNTCDEWQQFFFMAFLLWLSFALHCWVLGFIFHVGIKELLVYQPAICPMLQCFTYWLFAFSFYLTGYGRPFKIASLGEMVGKTFLISMLLVFMIFN